MTRDTLPPVTTCPECGAVAAEVICHLCKTPRPGFCAEAYELDEIHDARRPPTTTNQE